MPRFSDGLKIKRKRRECVKKRIKGKRETKQEVKGLKQREDDGTGGCEETKQ